MIGKPFEGDNPDWAADWRLPDACTFEEFEAKLGEFIWLNTQRYRADLPRPPYGSVTFQ